MRKFIRNDNNAVKFEFKPIQCDVCDKIFAAKSTLQLHRDILHVENNYNDVSLPNNENEVKTHKTVQNTNIQVNEIKNEDYSMETIKKEIDFCDVTLACKDQPIRAHKDILPEDLEVQFESHHLHHQDHFLVQVRGEYRNNHGDKKTDIFLLETLSGFWTLVKVEYKIQRKSSIIENQNKIFDTS